MRKKQLKRILATAFEAPPPQRKQAFLRALPICYVNHFSLVLTQAGYIRRSTWVLSAAVFAAALGAAHQAGTDGLWLAGALMPFAAMAAVTETGRSARHGMEELELSTRFGLKSVVLARMGIVGLVHFLLLALLAALGQTRALRTGVYLLVPYLLTDALGLAAVRRVQGREGLYICGSTAVLTAGASAALSMVRTVYAPESFPWWLGALGLCAALAAAEYRTTIQKTEELI